MIDGWGISCDTVVRWTSLDLSDDETTLSLVMACCFQATSHYLSQCWSRSLSPYSITRPQWVNSLETCQNVWHFKSKILHRIFHQNHMHHHWFRLWLVTCLAIIWTSAGILLYSNLRNKLQWNLKQNPYIFIKRNAFENSVCKMVAILSWPLCVKPC